MEFYENQLTYITNLIYLKYEEQLERLKLITLDKLDNIKNDHVEQFVQHDWKEECKKFLLKREYVQTTFGYMKGFVIVKITDNSIIVEHDVPNSIPHIINKSYKSGLFVAINYFERL